MNNVLKEIASTYHKDHCKDSCKDPCKSPLKDNNLLLLLAVVVILCCCCGQGFAGKSYGACKKDKPCGKGGFGGSSWIWILLLLLCFGGGGIGGLGTGGVLGTSGNVNTNVIKIDTAGEFEDEYDDCCC